MIIPLRTDSPLRRIPWMNWALIVVNIAIFLATSSNEDGSIHGPLAFYHGMPVKEAFALNPLSPTILQYFTSQFLHENWMHVLGNMLFLYIFGNNINDRMGQWGYLAFYLAGGVIAGVGYTAFSQVPVIGASGAIAAVTGAYIVLLPRSNITVFFFFFWIGVYEIPGLWFVGFVFAQDILGEVMPQFGGESVAHLAHISGTVFGAVTCLCLLRIGLLPRDQFDVLGLISRWNRRRQYRQMVTQGYNPFGYTPDRPMEMPQPKPNPNTDRIMELRSQISQAITQHELPKAAVLFLELKKIDPAQVLTRQAQLDVANQLASLQQYAEAAEAYEQFLLKFPNFEQIEQVELMLGVIYGRYLEQYERARQLLLRALSRLHTDRQIQLARTELARIEPLIPTAGSGI